MRFNESGSNEIEGSLAVQGPGLAWGLGEICSSTKNHQTWWICWRGVQHVNRGGGSDGSGRGGNKSGSRRGYSSRGCNSRRVRRHAAGEATTEATAIEETTAELKHWQ